MKRFLSFLFAALLFCSAAIPLLAAENQVTVRKEEELSCGKTAVDPEIKNRSVGPAQVAVASLEQEKAIGVFQEFLDTGSYSAADDMAVMAYFTSESETDFSGKTTSLSVLISGDLSEFYLTKAVVIHRYKKETEAIPVSLIKVEENGAVRMGFSTQNGLGDFIIVGAPLPDTEAAREVAARKKEAERQASSAAGEPQNASQPVSGGEPEGEGNNLLPLLGIGAVVVAIGAFGIAIYIRKKK